MAVWGGGGCKYLQVGGGGSNLCRSLYGPFEGELHSSMREGEPSSLPHPNFNPPCHSSKAMHAAQDVIRMPITRVWVQGPRKTTDLSQELHKFIYLQDVYSLRPGCQATGVAKLEIIEGRPHHPPTDEDHSPSPIPATVVHYVCQMSVQITDHTSHLPNPTIQHFRPTARA